MVLLGHYNRETNQKQLLLDHLFNVAEDGRQEAKQINQGNIIYLLGLFHDLGKADRNFQQKLLSNPHKHINHSSAGAKFIEEFVNDNIDKYSLSQHRELVEFCEILMYVITAHHGLYDIPAKSKIDKKKINKLFERVDYDLNSKTVHYDYERDVIPFTKEIEKELYEKESLTFKILFDLAFNEFRDVKLKISTDNLEKESFYRGALVRLYLSYLKNADIKDTINAFQEVLEDESIENKEELVQKYLESIEILYSSFEKKNSKSRINTVRTDLADQIKLRGIFDSPGIYRLDLPTGSGKTLMTLRYACYQMMKSNKKNSFI